MVFSQSLLLTCCQPWAGVLDANPCPSPLYRRRPRSRNPASKRPSIVLLQLLPPSSPRLPVRPSPRPPSSPSTCLPLHPLLRAGPPLLQPCPTPPAPASVESTGCLTHAVVCVHVTPSCLCSPTIHETHVFNCPLVEALYSSSLCPVSPPVHLINVHPH